MKRITVGIIAHVDSGKTTLTEALLYGSNTIRKLGRVDHRDSYLDTDSRERARGITIFSKLAMFFFGDTEVTLVDTPGHVDFGAEAERTLAILDYGVLVINGKEGVQAHTLTLLDLLEKNQVPTFIFVNKMDMEGAQLEANLEQLSKVTDGRAVNFSQSQGRRDEELAMCSEELMNEFLQAGQVSQDTLQKEIKGRKVFPCYFGSALKMEGIEELLEGIDTYCQPEEYPAEFGAKVFKIGRDKQGNRLTYAKITGGTIKVREEIPALEEKISQIRLYSGEKFEALDKAQAGQVVALVGLEKTHFGQLLGQGKGETKIFLDSVFHYDVALDSGENAFQAYGKIKVLEEEDPTLNIKWNPSSETISMELMGPVQQEILQSIIDERFGIHVEFEKGTIIYKETIASAVEGVGHYEPLKHFAEVHLLLEPAEEGTGLTFGTLCSEDVLDRNWQRLIMTHLLEKEHLGVLTKSPITDMKISILTGKAHQKHTEGGDFRQATYRAVRNGLMKAKSIVLEPWYDFTLEVPMEAVGRAMTDIKAMGGDMDSPITDGERSWIKGQCPVSSMADYHSDVMAYTKGRGRLICNVAGYKPCHNQDEVIGKLQYDPDRDLENSADSIFCQHGAGINIKWDKVEDYMALPYVYKGESGKNLGNQGAPTSNGNGKQVSDKELERIFEKTYGPQKQVPTIQKRTITPQADRKRDIDLSIKEEYLIVDGYNIIFAWPSLKELAHINLDSAREALIEILSNYQGFRKCRLMIVFDSYKVKGATGSLTHQGELEIAFTKEGETADAYIEKVTYNMDKEYSVRVATSDALEQNSILAHGCYRVSARELASEVEEAQCQIKEIIEKNNRKNSRNRIELDLH